jgi:hypothetical protein
MVPNQRKRLHDNAATPWGKAHISCETLTCGPPLWPAPEYAYGRRFLVPCCTARPYTGPLYGGAPRSSACARGGAAQTTAKFLPSLRLQLLCHTYVPRRRHVILPDRARRPLVFNLQMLHWTLPRNLRSLPC